MSQNFRTIGGNGNDSFTKLLIHANGSDASTTFRDSASGAKTITAGGNAQIDTAQSRFGNSSALFDGTGDYLSTASHADWDFGTSDFTIDFWVRFNVLPTTGNFMAFFTQYTDASNRFGIRIGGTGDYRIGFFAVSGGSTVIDQGYFWSAVTTGVWYHFAVARSSTSTWYLFIDGTRVSNDINEGASTSVPDLSGTVYIGSQNTTERILNGWIDELRVSKGIARWTANFTPPTAEYW